MACELKCVKCTKVDRSTKNLVYILVATFAKGEGSIENRYVGKTVTDLADFRKNVLQLSAGQNNSSASHLPDLKEKKGFMAGWRDDKKKSSVDDFCQHILKLPPNLLKDETVTSFFFDSSAADEDGAVKLLKNKESSKKLTKGKGDVAVAAPVVATSTQFTATSATSRVSSSFGAYEEISDLSKRPNHSLCKPEMTGEYSEVKIDSVTRTIIMDNNNEYAECVESTAPSGFSVNKSTDDLKLREPAGHASNSQLYASVYKPKNVPVAANTLSCEGLYEDTSCISKSRPETELMLYEDASSPNSYLQQPPLAPRPRGSSNPTLPEAKTSDVPLKKASSAMASPAAPLTPIPPVPQFPSPMLLSADATPNIPSGDSGESEEIQVVAIGDYDSTADNVLSFKKGTLATLLLQSDSNWWCIRHGMKHGWVPAAYWRTLNSGDCASLITKGDSPWFVGKLSRSECEALLMKHGKQQHFVVRESDSGHYALSIKYNDRIHHFPIEVTPDKKYNIGKHNFKTVNNVILYYQKNALFHDEEGRDITLGSPLVIIKH